MPHLSPAHHKTIKHDSPNKIDRGKTTKISWIQIHTEASQLLITYQTKLLTTWFLNLRLDEYIDNIKAQSLNFESKTHEAQLADQKPWKSSRRSSRRRKNRKASKWYEKWQTKQNDKEESRKVQNKKTHKTPPETDSQCKLSPLGRNYHVSSLNHLISKSSTNFVHILSPFDNELIKHNLREARDTMHDIEIRVLHKVYK
jgi:hypothetical protein